ncbi:MAG: response regulator transcription factor [Pyrinomonadaceae bacterium]|nr:response regulator transcription factor [Pyrinomonadaceae bacterium]
MNSKPPIKILLIGDYLIFRIGLKLLLEAEEKFSVVGEAANLDEAPDLIKRNKPDVVLINAPEVRKEDFPSFMEKNRGELPVLILTNSDGKKIFKACFELGASGLVSKEKDPEILFRAIEQVYEGDLWFDRTLMGETIRQLMDEKTNGNGKHEDDIYSTLTEREWDVLSQVCNGLKNKNIASNLFISETTVRHHLTSIFEKLKVNSRLQLVVLAFRKRLVEIPPKNVESVQGLDYL